MLVPIVSKHRNLTHKSDKLIPLPGVEFESDCSMINFDFNIDLDQDKDSAYDGSDLESIESQSTTYQNQVINQCPGTRKNLSTKKTKCKNFYVHGYDEGLQVDHLSLDTVSIGMSTSIICSPTPEPKIRLSFEVQPPQMNIIKRDCSVDCTPPIYSKPSWAKNNNSQKEKTQNNEHNEHSEPNDLSSMILFSVQAGQKWVSGIVEKVYGLLSGLVA